MSSSSTTKFDHYQEICATLRKYPSEGDTMGLVYCTLALGGEAGELQNKVKKLMRGDKKLTPEVRNELLQECGDIMWYLAMVAWELGCPFSMVAEMNLKKLLDRNERDVIKGDGDNR